MMGNQETQHPKDQHTNSSTQSKIDLFFWFGQQGLNGIRRCREDNNKSIQVQSTTVFFGMEKHPCIYLSHYIFFV